MTSWRDTTPEPVQNDLDSVAGAAIDAAQHLLGKSGEFFPFGVAMGSDGGVRLLAADPGLGEWPESQAVIDTLYAGVLNDRDGLRAAAIVADVRVEGSDAIRVRFEHRDGGPAMEILVRYAKKRFGSGIEYRETSVSGTDRQVWPVDER
jgi:hypothetical protein